MKKRTRTVEIFSLSFLDVVSCGFGAIILLLVMIKTSEPLVESELSTDMQSQIDEIQLQIDLAKQQRDTTIQALEKSRAELKTEKQQREELGQALVGVRAESGEMTKNIAASEVIVKQLESARQQLTEEIRRLQQQSQPVFSPSDSVIGGVPVDSEYIIFIIDTSGSMQSHAWTLVRRKMEEILAIYPQVKGLQVMNDMGDYMISQYKGKWIRDTPARRKSILKRLSSWNAFSNSSPVEGVSAAIQRFYDTDKKISLYIFGDDFSRGSIQEVVDIIARANLSHTGESRVRIHAVGFSVLLEKGAEANVARFAALMRRLAEDNNGSFVGLNSLK